MKTHRQTILSFLLSAALLVSLLPAALAWAREGDYHEGMALATDGSRWGYVNGAGSLTIPLRFASATPFSLGVAQVSENGKAGLLRPDGTFLLEPVYDSLESLGWGVYLASAEGKWKLLSITEIPADSRDPQVTDPHQLYPDADSATREEGETGTELVLRWTAGEAEVRLSLDALPQLLRERNVPGAAFPLDAGRRAAFPDVSHREWFSPWTEIAYNVSLMEGRDGGQFRPTGNLKISEALKLAALMDGRAAGRTVSSPRQGQPWYDGYLQYALRYGILLPGEFEDYERPITRAELALLLARTVLFRNSADLNDPSRVRASIPDVAAGDFASAAIFGLYAKGVITGSDSALTFRPNAVITRAEVAAIVARMVRPEQRVSLWAGEYRTAALESDGSLSDDGIAPEEDSAAPQQE